MDDKDISMLRTGRGHYFMMEELKCTALTANPCGQLAKPLSYNTDCSAVLTCCLPRSRHYLAICDTGQLPFVCLICFCQAQLDLSHNTRLTPPNRT